MTLEPDLLDGLNLFLFAGILQSIALASYLIIQRPSTNAKRILAVWILLLGLSNLQIIIQTSDLYRLFGQDITLFAPLSLNLFFGPLIWLFCKLSTYKENRFSKSDILHLIPGTLEFLYFLILYCQPLKFKQQFYGQFHWPHVEPLLEVVSSIAFVVYLYYSAKILKQYSVDIKEKHSDSDIETYNWLKKLLLLLLGFSILWLLLTFIDVGLYDYSLDYLYFYPYYFFIAFIPYYIGFSRYTYKRTSPIKIEEVKAPIKPAINQDRINLEVSRLRNLMAEKELFLNDSLKAKELADHLGINVQTLSIILNQGLNQSFYDYINELRINHFIAQMKKANLELVTLSGLAKDSGFRSEASFYRIFKKVKGTTPKNYLKSFNKKL